MAWNVDIATRYWAGKKRYTSADEIVYEEREKAMRCYVVNRETAKFFEKEDGSRVWNVPKSARELSADLKDMAVVVALDERNFNESLNAYVNGELYAQLAYDKHLGWVS